MKTKVTSEQVSAYLEKLARESKSPAIQSDIANSYAYQTGAASSIIASLVNDAKFHREHYRTQILGV